MTTIELKEENKKLKNYQTNLFFYISYFVNVAQDSVCPTFQSCTNLAATVGSIHLTKQTLKCCA